MNWVIGICCGLHYINTKNGVGFLSSKVGNIVISRSLTVETFSFCWQHSWFSTLIATVLMIFHKVWPHLTLNDIAWWNISTTLFEISLNMRTWITSSYFLVLFDIKLTISGEPLPFSNGVILNLYRHLRPSMMQQLLRRLVFDVPMLSEYCKIALKVRVSSEQAIRGTRPLP